MTKDIIPKEPMTNKIEKAQIILILRFLKWSIPTDFTEQKEIHEHQERIQMFINFILQEGLNEEFYKED